MNDTDFTSQIKQELDKQAINDLKKLLQTAEGRRFFSWLLEKCGRDSQDYKGNSRDVFTAGMRNTAVMLIATAKHLGMDGLDLIHKAEREYVQLQFNILNDLKHKTGGL